MSGLIWHIYFGAGGRIGLQGRKAQKCGFPAMLERNSLFWGVKGALHPSKARSPLLTAPAGAIATARADNQPGHQFTHCYSFQALLNID